ncbi:MAG: alpha-2-macroglobulin family protein [Limisphaerales bacterium]
MKKIVASLALVAVAITLINAADPPAKLSKAQNWKAYDAALKKGLPKTAVTHLEPIIAQTLRDKDYAEAIKAIGKKMALEGTIQGNKAQEKIRRMEAEITKAPKEMKPVMEAILANWYWHYFQQNRWRFLQRTRTGASAGNDFETWDLPRIFNEIDKQFNKALVHKAVLKKIPVADYNELLQKGTAPDNFRPTMYDFLVYNALQFYSSGEQAGAKAEDAFELSATDPIFDSAAKFMTWQIKTTDTESRTVKALNLYRDLLAFHKNDKDKSAYIDADLARINFGKNKAFGETKNDRYRAALKRFIGEWADHRISARARFNLASSLNQEGDKVQARKIALQGANAFPKTPGGAQCHNLVIQIETKSSNVTIERVWNDPQSEITIKYRNVDQIHFRVVAENWEAAMKRKRGNPNWLDNNERAALLRKEVIKEWSVKLPPTADYHEAVKTIKPPKGMPQGFYYLISSHTENFTAANNVCYYTSFWASDLSIVMRQRSGNGLVEGFVLDANSGEPVANTKVRAWFRERNGGRTEVAPTMSDANGHFKFQAVQRGYLLLASKGGQQLSTANDYYNHGRISNPRPYDRTIFFTDRSLYRPGQTVEYKGLCIHVDQHNDNYRTIPNSFVTVIFRDRNGKEVSRQQHRANDYGSFSGKFTAPRDRVLGRMSLQITTGPRGNASINVEEYKRPKFQVELEAPKTAGKLSGEVALIGKATGYTGAAINDAKVKWRVVREVRYPAWWGWHYWWRPAPQGKSQEIAHGTATTKPNGAFDVNFIAKPDLTVAAKDEPTFRYTIHADVTDTTGETRSDSHSINLGYTALKASVSAADWQAQGKATAVSISTTSLDGIGQKAEGTLKLYALQQPANVERAKLVNPRNVMPMRHGRFAPEFVPAPDSSNVNSWKLGKVIAEKDFTTDASGQANFNFNLEEGTYRVILETQDRFGKTVTARAPIQVLNPQAAKLKIRVPHVLKSPTWSVEPGNEFMALWGSGYGEARAFIEIEHRRKILQSFWTERGLTQFAIKQAVNEAMRGGFTLHVTMVRENRAYLSSRKINVPWTNKNLTVKWEHFTDKLQPGQKEKWTAVITGSNAEKAVAEMAAVLYDESLDQFKPHQWQTSMNVFRQDYARLNQRFENSAKGLQHLHGQWNRRSHQNISLNYRSFPREITANLYGYAYYGAQRKSMAFRGGPGGGRPEAMMAMAEGAPMMARAAAKAAPPAAAFGGAQEAQNDSAVMESDDGADKRANGSNNEASSSGPNLDQVTARKNLNETAFFLPHIVANKKGEVRLEFSMPEALTKWKFMGFTHDNELRSGFLSGSTVTAKDIMVQPNPPRFLREGDQLEFTVKVTNMTDKEATGKVRLTFADALTNDSVDDQLGNADLDQKFTVPAKQSKTYSWRINVPDDLGFLTYKAVGGTDTVTDGEQGFLPVLSRRIFVTESLPLPIRGPKTKTFNFDKLIASGGSDTIKHERYTVQMVSNPNWYAVMALPYLMESPHPSTMSTFTRLYANGLAQHIANSDPRIRGVFDKWRNTPALDSPLEKNQDLKAVMLEETPWLRQAKSESQARRNVGILFEDNRLTAETQMAIRKLRETQFADGAWPWMPGGRPSDYITLYITTGFGRMRAMHVDMDVNMAIKAVNRLDNWIDKNYREILKHGNKDANNLSSLIAQYLYCRSFFLKDRAVAPQHLEAINYFLGQAVKTDKDGTQYFLRLSRMNQAQVAIAMNRFGKFQKKANYNKLAKLIIKSIKERSVTNEEMGLFWRDQEHSYWWYRAPIETQAMMIEAFHEVTQDFEALEEAKVWLLKQKQTQDWKTTKATADACYALLLQGANPLVSDALVEVTVGNHKIEPKNVEAGTGFYEHRFLGSDVKPSYGKIKLTKHDEGVAWGSVHWQYMEDISKVTPHEGTPLKLTKQLFTKVNTSKGPQLKPISGGLKTGDELVVRLVLRTDRDMEYVHMKDQRGSGTEPTNVLSKYKYQDGLGYYQMTRDTASHFYIDYLPKGVYVFEYNVRVQHKGQYQSGMASIQCLYAPEFNSHSASHKLSVN